MKKRMIFVLESLWIGGIETALVNLLNRMDYEKYDVTCLVIRGNLNMADRITKKCRLVVADREKMVTFGQPYKYNRLYHLTEESKNPSKLHQLMMWAVPAIKWIENRLYIRYIRQQMKGEAFDTCVIYSDRAAEIAVRAVRAERYLMFYHHGAMRKEYHDEIGYKAADKIIAVSNTVEQKLRQYRPKYADKMTAIHNLADVEGIRSKGAERIPEELAADKFNIVSCGRISHEKGMDLAVEACAKLVETGCRDIHWWIVGGGPDEGSVRDRIRALKLEDYIKITGMKSNPYPFLRMADLYVQPSRVDAYPMTVLEALILGVPVVATDTDGAREMIQQGINGLLCPIDAKQIADIIAAVIADQQKLQTIKHHVSIIDFEEQNRNYLAQLEMLLDGCI